MVPLMPPADDLARRALAASLPGHIEAVSACGDAHRIGDRMRAAEELIAVSERLAELHAELLAMGPEGVAAALLALRLGALVSELNTAQATHDTVRIADLLEYEALPLLARCRGLADR